MLKNLTIKNGEMTLAFDPLNTVYTVNVKDDIDSLEFDYIVLDDVQVSIFNNHLEYGKNEVVFSVYKDEMVTSYYFYVYKEKNESISHLVENNHLLSIPKEEVSTYAVPVIASICFLIILLNFTLLFKKKKKMKNIQKR